MSRHHLIGPKEIINPLVSSEKHIMDAYNSMLQDERWINSSCFRGQYEILIEYLYNPPISLSMLQLENLFGSRHCVQKQYYKIQKKDTLKPHGRPRLLNLTQKKELDEVLAFKRILSIV